MVILQEGEIFFQYEANAIVPAIGKLQGAKGICSIYDDSSILSRTAIEICQYENNSTVLALATVQRVEKFG